MPLPIVRESRSQVSLPERVIAIASGKGGVGKSTLTLLLALSLAKKGVRVGVLDADLYGPSVKKIFPFEVPPKMKGKRLLPARARGVRFLSAAHFGGGDTGTLVRAPLANRLVNQFFRQVDWADVECLLVDFPPGTGDIPMTIAEHYLTGAVLVTTPQEVALLDAKKACRLFTRQHIPIEGVIENMAGYLHPETGELLPLFEGPGAMQLAEEYKTSLLGSLPFIPKLAHACDRGDTLLPIVEEICFAMIERWQACE